MRKIITWVEKILPVKESDPTSQHWSDKVACDSSYLKVLPYS